MGQAHVSGLNKKNLGASRSGRSRRVWVFFLSGAVSIKLGEQYFEEIYFFKTHMIGQL